MLYDMFRSRCQAKRRERHVESAGLLSMLPEPARQMQAHDSQLRHGPAWPASWDHFSSNRISVTEYAGTWRVVPVEIARSAIVTSGGLSGTLALMGSEPVMIHRLP